MTALRIAMWVVWAAVLPVTAQPRWWQALPEDPGRVYGRGMAEAGLAGTDALETARREALRDLAQSLICRLRTETIAHDEDGDTGVSSSYVSSTTIESEIDLVNVAIINESLVAGVAFILLAVERDGMANAYRRRIERSHADARQAYNRALELEDFEPRRALQAMEESLRAMREAEAYAEVYQALVRWTSQPPEAADMPGTGEITARIDRLAASTPRTLSEVTAVLADAVQATAVGRRWAVLPIEYENSGAVSELGHALQTGLEAALGSSVALTAPGEADVVVRGRLLRESGGVLVVLRARDRAVQHFIESVSLDAWGRAVEPVDLDRLLVDRLALHRAMAAPSGLGLEFRTDRCFAGGPVVYRFGDQPVLAVRVTEACTLRVIYVMSDGRRLLLLDRHPIGVHQANTWVRLPLELEACAPAGVGQLVVAAATNDQDARLPDLRVQNVDMGGGWFQPVIVEPLDEAMTRTRGMMMRRPEHYAESVSQWTVFEE